MLYVTGDTHGELGRFLFMRAAVEANLSKDDMLIICGDWGYIIDDSPDERTFLDYLAEKPYKILWVDGNHENFDLIETYPVEEWCGGKVHIIRRDKSGEPKIIHLMRGQIFEIEGKSIFTFGGGYSIDRYWRVPHISWWPQEMPTDDEMKEAISNLAKCNNKVDYIITHTAPDDTMSLYHPDHTKEKPLNNFLEWVRENVEYKHWYMGHLHLDTDMWRNQTILWFDVREVESNKSIE